MHRARVACIISGMDFNELLRLLLNLIRKGTIEEIDLDAARCRVRSGELLTVWIPFIALRAGTTVTWNPPTVGEQVIIFSPGGEMADGVAIGGIYSDDAPAPSNSASEHVTKYPDGALIRYDHEAHSLEADLPEGATGKITIPASLDLHSHNVTVHADQTTCTGNLTVQGLLTGQAGLAITGTGAGDHAAIIQGSIHSTDDITAGDISLRGHHHQYDDGDTSEAKP